MRDFSIYKQTDTVFSGAERKFEIIIGGRRYIVKLQRNSEQGLLYNHVSEYIGSHMFNLLDIPAQETFLGTYHGKNAVVIKNFLSKDEFLIPFNGVGESTLEQDKEMYQYSYDDIVEMLKDNRKNTDVAETVERFWDMFIVDALIGNFDRHGGNWGFIRSYGKYKIAPVYDNGSCLYPRLNTDEQIWRVLESHAEIDKRIFAFPTSHIKHHGKKSSYYQVIHSTEYEECNKALIRITEKIDLHKVYDLIDSVEGISEVRNLFYKTMLKERYRKILLSTYNILK